MCYSLIIGKRNATQPPETNMTNYEMNFDSYADAVDYFTGMGMVKIPVAGVETWSGNIYTDEGAKKTLIARGSIKHASAKDWTFFEK